MREGCNILIVVTIAIIISWADDFSAHHGHGNRHARFRDGIHGRGQQRDLQLDVAGQVTGETDIARQNGGMCWQQQDIIKGKGFLRNAHIIGFHRVWNGRQL